MLKTTLGSPDGAATRLYSEGTEHDLTQTQRERELAGVFVREGWAELAGGPPAREAPESVQEEKSLEDKDRGPAPEAKAPRRRR